MSDHDDISESLGTEEHFVHLVELRLEDRVINGSMKTDGFPMSNLNEAFTRLESRKTRYRIVLDADC